MQRLCAGFGYGCASRGDGRRLEVVTDGLPLFHGAQLALDATMVSALWCDGTPHRRAAEEDGAVLRAARRRKGRTYPELTRHVWWSWRVRLAGDGQKKRTTFFCSLQRPKFAEFPNN